MQKTLDIQAARAYIGIMSSTQQPRLIPQATANEPAASSILSQGAPASGFGDERYWTITDVEDYLTEEDQ